MSFEAEERQGWGRRIAKALASALGTALLVYLLTLAGSYTATLLRAHVAYASQLQLALLVIALASALAFAGALLERSPLSPLLSLLSRLLGVYAFLLGLGGTKLTFSVQQVRAELDLSPVVLALLAGALILLLVDAYSWASKSA